MVDISGLERFKSSLSKAKANIKTNRNNPKIKQIIDIATEEIERAYSGTNVKMKVVVEFRESGFTIYAKDRSSGNPLIAFDEFGTGYYARGTYPGKLPPPTQIITFTSAKKERSTKGWDYYYWDDGKHPNADTKVTHGGIKGWMTPNGLFHTGQVANATMYKACKVIIARIRKEVA